jgi:hypothetical protein
MTAYDWQTDAICAQTDPELFFSPDPKELEAAMNLCGTCPVQRECADLRKKENHRHGVWAGEYYSDSSTPKKRGPKPSFDHEHARELAAQGIPRKQIAQQLGCTKAALDYALNPKRKTK